MKKVLSLLLVLLFSSLFVCACDKTENKTTENSEAEQTSEAILKDIESSEISKENNEKVENTGIAFTYEIVEDYAVLKSCSVNDETAILTIDNEYKGKPVKEIKKNAFSGAKLKTLTIPESVYKIEAGAFLDCKITNVILNSTDGWKMGGQYISNAILTDYERTAFCLINNTQYEFTK